jgi:glutamate/tyrosine decarboxylase-like PLP-dependent enzyme
VLKALSMLGFGRERVIKVPVDAQGRINADALPEVDDLTILIIQAGNVNSGAFDPAEAIYAAAQNSGCWIHVDGAFGLWAAASPTYAHLTDGFERANSWAVDGHKWLNVPYDSGLVICRNEADLRAAMSYSAAYLELGESREPGLYTPEMSRRARGIEVWAALLSLGRSGLAALIEQSCRFARQFSDGLSTAGYEVLNEVVLNQVMVSFGDDEATRKVIAAVQRDGTCWCGGTTWHGHAAMRISVSSWATTQADVKQSLGAILRIAGIHSRN